MTASKSSSIGIELPREMARVRDVVIPPYIEIGPAGALSLQLMRNDLDAAAKAMSEGDVVEMIRTYEAIKGWTL